MPNPTSPDADISELADFAELLGWTNGKTSAREIAAYLGRIDENDGNAGCENDENAERLDEVMNEIEHRGSACASGYPFFLESQVTVLQYPVPKPEKTQQVVYLYLLLSTRLNMKDNRNHAGIDGTSLLELLSAHALKNYLGRDKVRSFVFGTSSEDNFENKVKELCSNLGEGSGFRSLDNAPQAVKALFASTVNMPRFSGFWNESDGSPYSGNLTAGLPAQAKNEGFSLKSQTEKPGGRRKQHGKFH